MFTKEVVKRTETAFANQGDPTYSVNTARYMKHIAPFLGIPTPDRRRLLRGAWKGLTEPTSDELGLATAELMERDEREYHYAACDLITRFRSCADEQFLRKWVTGLLTTKPWWDTVDAAGSAAVSPLCRRFGDSETIDGWSESGDIWLVRAAIQHQRGWRQATDVHRVLALCDRHWKNDEFFVAKAIGWALRDMTRFDRDAVADFMGRHSGNRVAEREAKKGLARTA